MYIYNVKEEVSTLAARLTIWRNLPVRSCKNCIQVICHICLPYNNFLHWKKESYTTTKATTWHFQASGHVTQALHALSPYTLDAYILYWRHQLPLCQQESFGMVLVFNPVYCLSHTHTHTHAHTQWCSYNTTNDHQASPWPRWAYIRIMFTLLSMYHVTFASLAYYVTRV